MAAEPGSSEGAAEVVAGVGQIFKMGLELAAASPLPARQVACTACRLFALRAAVVGDALWLQVGCGAVEVLVRCNPASSRKYAGRARHPPAFRSASVVVAREGVSAAALASDVMYMCYHPHPHTLRA